MIRAATREGREGVKQHRRCEIKKHLNMEMMDSGAHFQTVGEIII